MTSTARNVFLLSCCQALLLTNAAGLIGSSQINRYLLHRHAPDRLLKWGNACNASFGVLLAVAAVTGWGGLHGIARAALSAATEGVLAEQLARQLRRDRRPAVGDGQFDHVAGGLGADAHRI